MQQAALKEVVNLLIFCDIFLKLNNNKKEL